MGLETVGIFTTLSVTNVPIHFRVTLIKRFLRWMHKQKVTKTGVGERLGAHTQKVSP